VNEKYKNLPLRNGVGIVVLNNENKVFVAKRIDNPKNFWQMPQGGIDRGENFYEAALRELKEETSIISVELIKEIENIIKPSEVILVADSLTGQVAAEVAKEFKNTVNVSGIILTRADGDGRGGAAVSMKFVSQVPIKFLGVGEKVENFEVFHPDRIANRILGMGDIVSLVEKI